MSHDLTLMPTLFFPILLRVADMAASRAQVQKLHVDVGVQGVAVDFCNNPQVSRAEVSTSSPHCSVSMPACTADQMGHISLLVGITLPMSRPAMC